MVQRIAHQFAQNTSQCRPLHDAELEVAVGIERPAEVQVGGCQPLRQVGLPLRCGVREPLVGCGQAARQCLQVLQGVAHVFLHLRTLRLVHQRQQPGADVVVQILRDAQTLFAASAFHGLVVGHCAAQLFDHAVGQACVFAGEQPLPAPREAQHQAQRHLLRVCARHAGHAGTGGPGGIAHRHHQCRATTDQPRARHRAFDLRRLQRLEEFAQQRREQRRVPRGRLLHLARHAVQLLESALGGQHAAACHLVQDPLPRRSVYAQRQKQSQRQRRELP